MPNPCGGTGAELLTALIAGVKVIHTWHNARAYSRSEPDEKSMREAWRIYWRNAPEMAAIREALPGVDLDEVEKL